MSSFQLPTQIGKVENQIIYINQKGEKIVERLYDFLNFNP